MEEQRLERILAGVRTLLTTRVGVSLVDDGIDLSFSDGVEVSCQSCGVAWPIARRHFRTLAWWACPRGCRRG